MVEVVEREGRYELISVFFIFYMKFIRKFKTSAMCNKKGNNETEYIT